MCFGHDLIAAGLLLSGPIDRDQLEHWLRGRLRAELQVPAVLRPEPTGVGQSESGGPAPLPIRCNRLWVGLSSLSAQAFWVLVTATCVQPGFARVA
jgi:hypothetical protein